MTDYAALDEEADKELREMYGQSSEVNNDPPEDSGTGSEENPALEQELVDTSTLEADKTSEETEATVPESRYQAAVSAMNQAQRELADYRKSEAARESQIQQLQQQLQESQQALLAKEAQSAASTQEETFDDDELNEALEMYPEVTKPLLKRNAHLEKEVANMKAAIDGIKNDVGNVKNVATRYEEDAQAKAHEAYLSAIRQTHADVDTIHKDPAFVSWFEQQSPRIQDLWQSDSPVDVVNLLNLFRAGNPVHETAKPVDPQPKDDKLARAKAEATPNVKSLPKQEQSRKWTTAEIDKMSPQDYLKHEAEIDAAMARGEIT